ncbi:PREDICTED: transcription factor PAR1 [Camelina sativa]|uniref:Transcription factor PAR1 n=1 Tax=Camelina sativa TaxID=90675 RepID=A0ABM0Z005_CAMSA|nr:PREDICTED: transcription factor PAR1 [Camelina sativa]
MEETLATPDTTRRSLSPSCSSAVKSRAAGFERRTKRRLSETKASVREDYQEEEEEEEDEVKEKIEALQRIIPGGTALGVDALFEETAGYIMSLQCQIKTIKVLTSFLQRLDQEDMKFGG